MYYVKMVDQYFSGWGDADGRRANYVIECETWDEAIIVRDNAKSRSDMTDVKIVTKKPIYNESTDQVTYAERQHVGRWFKPNSFK